MKTLEHGNIYLSWALRILLILTILLWGTFSLDVFSEGYNFWETIGAFLIHNIPSFVMIIVLVIAWKHENAGGILLMAVVLAFVIFFTWKRGELMMGTLILVSIPFLIGALFVLNYYVFGNKKRSGELQGS